MISADLHALMVRRGSGKGRYGVCMWAGRDGGRWEGGPGTSRSELNYPQPHRSPTFPWSWSCSSFFRSWQER